MTTPFACRPGVLYTATGEARVTLPPGRYTVYATRGPEYSLAEATVTAYTTATTMFALRVIRGARTRLRNTIRLGTRTYIITPSK